MPIQDLHVRFKTPNWKWCEIANPDGKTKTGERCRFCREIKKRGEATRYTCLIYDKELLVEYGSVVRCGACSCFADFGPQEVIPPELDKKPKRAELSPGQLALKVIKQFKSTYRKYSKQYPSDIAIDVTADVLSQEWKCYWD